MCVSEYLSIYVLSCIHVMNVYRLECMCKVLNARLHCSWWYSCAPITSTSNTKWSTCKGRLSVLYSTKHSFYTAANTPCVSAQTCKNSHESAIQTSTHPLFTTHPNPAPWLDKPPPCTELSPIFQKKKWCSGIHRKFCVTPEMCYLLDALFRNDLPQLPCPQSPKSALLPLYFFSYLFSKHFTKRCSAASLPTFSKVSSAAIFSPNVLLIK